MQEDNSAVPDSDINSSPDLTLDDITAFFTAKGISNSCSVCGTNHWLVTASVRVGDEHIVPIIPINSKVVGGSISARGFREPLVLMACNNCGYVRLHDRDMMVEFVRGLKEQAQSEKQGQTSGQVENNG